MCQLSARLGGYFCPLLYSLKCLASKSFRRRTGVPAIFWCGFPQMCKAQKMQALHIWSAYCTKCTLQTPACNCKDRLFCRATPYFRSFQCHTRKTVYLARFMLVHNSVGKAADPSLWCASQLVTLNSSLCFPFWRRDRERGKGNMETNWDTCEGSFKR